MAHALTTEDLARAGLELASVLADGFVRGACEVVLDEDGWGWPRRFDEAQTRVLTSCMAWRPGAYRQLSQTTSGVALRFCTDATQVALAVRMTQEPPVVARLRAHGEAEVRGAVSCVVDGRPLGLLEPRDGMVRIPLTDPSRGPGVGVVALPGLGERHDVSVWLPCNEACAIRELWADGTFVEPVSAQGRLLVLGDSVGQGLFAPDSASTWPALTAQALGLELVNQSVGLQVFQPTAASSVRTGEVRHAIVQLGGAYRAFGGQDLNLPAIARDVRTYLFELLRACPHAELWAITPFSHDAPQHSEALAHEVAAAIRACAPALGIRVLEGDALVDAGSVLRAGSAEVLDARGHAQFAERLLAVMAGGSPQSHSNRRKVRTP